MNLEPFVSVDGVPFSASADEVIRRRGAPQRRARNEVGLNELDYEDTVFRFQDSGRLEEVTARTRVVHMGTLAVPYAALESFVRARDPSMFERAGFIVSPRFGLAFAPSGGHWVTALAAHCLEQWRALRPHHQPPATPPEQE
jgi:hypothetical protein